MQNWRTFNKIELHRHLEGAVRVQTVLDVAAKAGIKLPGTTVKEIASHACVTSPVLDLATMLKKMGIMQSVLATREIIERVAFEACEDAFLEGIHILELRYSPGFIKVGHPRLDEDQIHEAIVSGVKRAENKFSGKLAVGLIGIITREQPLTEAANTTDFVVNHRESFVGLDLAGDEAGFDCRLFQKFFMSARAAGLGITVHAGEARTQSAAQSVKDSIEFLGATRIGHGVQIIHDERVMEFVRKKSVVLEICPTSNVYTGAVNRISDHPIRKLMDSDLKITICSDDPTFFGIDLTHEYDVLSKNFGFNSEDFARLNENALKASFIDKKTAVTTWKSVTKKA